jgi:hypothetical protein
VYVRALQSTLVWRVLRFQREMGDTDIYYGYEIDKSKALDYKFRILLFRCYDVIRGIFEIENGKGQFQNKFRETDDGGFEASSTMNSCMFCSQ